MTKVEDQTRSVQAAPAETVDSVIAAAVAADSGGVSGTELGCVESMVTKRSHDSANGPGAPAQLTAAEMRAQEREAKRARKALEATRKREEKRLKREEAVARREEKRAADEAERQRKRAAVDAEREAKRAAREAEKAEKTRKREAEQRAKEARKREEEDEKRAKLEKEEAHKREEAQRREKGAITNFFKKAGAEHPPAGVTGPTTVTVSDGARDVAGSAGQSDADGAGATGAKDKAFDSFFLPFHLNAHVTVHVGSTTKCLKWEAFLNGTAPAWEPSEQLGPRSCDPPPTAAAVAQLDAPAAQALFPQLPLQYLRFYENRRAPYYGTRAAREGSALSRADPFEKLAGVVYDVDSDFSDEEGEDVNMEESEDSEESDDEDLGVFVESDDAPQKRAIVGPLVPQVAYNAGTPSAGDSLLHNYLHTLEWKTLRTDVEFPIDPMGNYWGGEKDTNAGQVPTGLQNSSAPTPATAATGAGASAAVGGGAPLVVKKRTLDSEPATAALCNFIRANGTLSINTLAELAVKNEPLLAKASRAVVKNSIRALARFDKKNSRWEIG